MGARFRQGLGLAAVAAAGAALALPLAVFAGDTAKLGFGDCIQARKASPKDVGRNYAVVEFEWTDTCYFPAKTLVEYRVREDGQWKDWRQSNRDGTEFGDRWHTREARVGDLRPDRRYEVRSGVEYFGDTAFTDGVAFDTQFTRAKDISLTLIGDRREARYRFSYQASPGGENAVVIYLARGEPVQFAVTKLHPSGAKCHGDGNGNRVCEWNYPWLDVDEPGQGRGQLTRGETYYVYFELYNEVYRKYYGTQTTETIKFVAGESFNRTVGEQRR